MNDSGVLPTPEVVLRAGTCFCSRLFRGGSWVFGLFVSCLEFAHLHMQAMA